MRISKLLGPVVLGLAIAVVPGATRGDVTMPLDFTFSGTGATSGSPIAQFTDSGTDTVTLLLTNAITSPTSAFISEWDFNFNPTRDLSTSPLTINHSAGLTANSVSQGLNAFKADGDGNYDISFVFPVSNSDPTRFLPGQTSTYIITGTGISASNFNFGSVGGALGTFLSAAHLQDTTTSDGSLSSGWVGARVPEPSPLLLGLASIAPIAGVGYMRRRRQAGAATV